MTNEPASASAPAEIDPSRRGFCALALVLGLGSCLWIGRSTPFSPEAWQAGDLRDRGRMVRDLYESQRLIGLTRAEVIALLGPPTADQRYDMVYEYRAALPGVIMQKLGLQLEDGRVVEVLLYD